MNDQSTYHASRGVERWRLGCSERDNVITAFAASGSRETDSFGWWDDNSYEILTNSATKSPLAPPQILATGRLAHLVLLQYYE
jgi:hypothetical protein